MSATIKAAITALKGRIAAAYSAISAKGGTLPGEQTAGNLAAAILSIPTGGGGLPAEYTEITCVHSQNAYTDLGIKGKGSDVYILDFQNQNSQRPNTILGYRAGFKNGVFFGSYNGAFDSSWYWEFTNQGNTISAIDNNRHTVVISPAIFFDWQPKTTVNNPTYETSGNMRLGASAGVSTDTAQDILIYRFTHKSIQGEILHDYVPCYRNSDNAVGFYEVINGTFHGKDGGGGSFTIGTPPEE